MRTGLQIATAVIAIAAIGGIGAQAIGTETEDANLGPGIVVTPPPIEAPVEPFVDEGGPDAATDEGILSDPGGDAGSTGGGGSIPLVGAETGKDSGEAQAVTPPPAKRIPDPPKSSMDGDDDNDGDDNDDDDNDDDDDDD